MSLPENTSGCSIAPVAKMWWLARTWCSVSPCQTGDEPVEMAERRRRAEDLDPGRAGPLGELASLVVAAFPQQPAAGLGALVGEHDVGAELGGGDRSGEAGAAAADDEHVGVAPAVFGAPSRARAWVLGSRPRPAAWRSTFS